jgi:hypothetical protein
MTERKARTNATAKTTAGLSAPLRFAQDDSFLLTDRKKGKCKGKDRLAFVVSHP